MMPAIGVAEAKRRFSELADRVAHGERFVISRRGRPIVALVAPHLIGSRSEAPAGLAAVAGALAEWEELDADVADVIASRRSAQDRPAPLLD